MAAIASQLILHPLISSSLKVSSTTGNVPLPFSFPFPFPHLLVFRCYYTNFYFDGGVIQLVEINYIELFNMLLDF